MKKKIEIERKFRSLPSHMQLAIIRKCPDEAAAILLVGGNPKIKVIVDLGELNG